MNAVVIITDTMRRDYLGLYGNRWVHTPHLDRFAERCVVFDRAYLASFPTMPMRADLCTGKFTFTYLGWEPLPLDEVILPQVLTDAGYLTAAVVDTPFYVRRGFGYDRGFRHFQVVPGQGSERADINYERRYEEDYCAPMTGAAAERWLQRHYKDKFFLYVDMWDPHEPWDPPAHYVQQYYPKWDGTVVRPPYDFWKKVGIKKKDLEIARACYAGEVTMVDRAIGRIIERVESLGILDETLIVITADHGFDLGEHGLFGKCIFERVGRRNRLVASPIYEEVARVPLLVHLPGAQARRVNALVQPPDLTATILDLLGVEIPDTMQGRSAASVVKTEKGRGRTLAVSTMPLYNPGQVAHVVDALGRDVKDYLAATITSGPWSMLYTCEGKPVELYNLKSDPQQRKNIARKHQEVVNRLHRQFFNFIKECGASEDKLAPRARL